MKSLSKILKEIEEEEIEIQVENYKIFCDMDGVLVDFNRRFEQFSGMSPNEYRRVKGEEYGEKKAMQMFWHLIDGEVGVRFWVGMPWMPGGKELWNYIKPYNPTLLSSPSANEVSRMGKRLWVRNNIPGTKLILASHNDKQKQAAPNHILIDDYYKNTSQWKAAGGITIPFKSTPQAIGDLKELGL